MKYILPIILIALASITQARDVTFAWYANPPTDQVTSYRLEILNENDAWVTLGIASSTEPDVPVPTTLRIPIFPDREAKVRAIAVNSSGESDPSDPITVGVKPGTVQGLKTTVIVNIQVSP